MHVLPCRLRIGARECGNFPVDCVRICSRDEEVLDGLCLQLQAGSPSVTLVVVGQHVGTLAGVLVFAGCGVDETVVSTSDMSPCVIGRLHVVVVKVNGIDVLGVGKLTRQCQGERYGHLIVDANGSLPYLWHLEVGVNAGIVGHSLSVVLQDSLHVTYVGLHAASEL